MSVVIRDGDILLDPKSFEQEVDPFAAERRIRPQSPEILQIQMDALDFFMVFEYPDKLYEFNDPNQLECFLVRVVGDEELVRRSMALMSNFKLVNINLVEQRPNVVRGYNKLF